MPGDKTDLFNITERLYKNNIVILDINGDIDIASTQNLQKYLNNLIDNSKTRIIINLKNVSYISSTGWGLFINTIKIIRTNNGDLKLAEMNPAVKTIFDMTSLSKYISTYSTIEDAADNF